MLLITKIEKIAGEIKLRKELILTEHGLTLGQDQFVLALAVENGMTMGLLAKKLDIRPPSVAKFAAHLEKLGLIKREASRLDSRQQHAFLTETGKELAETLLESYKKLDKKTQSPLKQKNKDKLNRLLDTLYAKEDRKKPAIKKPKKAGKSIKDLAKKKSKTKNKND